jgi:3-dehydroquinate dehydratase-1
MAAAAIGPVTLGSVPRVVLAVAGDDPALPALVVQGIDLLELRVDRMAVAELGVVAQQAQALRRHALPMIGTVRAQAEGGQQALSDAQRLALFEALMPWVDAVDIELQAAPIRLRVVALARQHRRAVIVSCHLMSATPAREDLDRLWRESLEAGADIVKIAAWAQQPEDVWRLLDFTRAHRDRPIVTMAMGPIGTISRLVAPLAGSVLAYTSPSPTLGQLPPAELIQGLRRCYPAFDHAHPARPGAPR